MLRRLLPPLCAVLILPNLYHAMHSLLRPWGLLPAVPAVDAVMPAMLLAAWLCHASYALGWRLMLAFFALSFTLTWLFEQLGVSTGWIYGEYVYSTMLGPRLGHVPVVIPLAWLTMLYPCLVLAHLISERRPFPEDRGPLARCAWLSLLAAILMTGWDVPLDPYMSRTGRWHWKEEGAWFGVPLHNYVGWLVTAFTVLLSYSLWQRRQGLRPLGEVSRAMAALPVLVYGATAALNFARAEPAALRLATCFSMGVPVLLASATLLRMPPTPDPARRAANF
jgi:putative membrane protein